MRATKKAVLVGLAIAALAGVTACAPPEEEKPLSYYWNNPKDPDPDHMQKAAYECDKDLRAAIWSFHSADEQMQFVVNCMRSKGYYHTG